jgi:plasmid stabilization system protein ParE
VNRLPLRFHPAASAELVVAAEWYEGAHEGLARDFSAEVEAAVARIARNPARWPLNKLDGRTRRVRLRRFPYSLVYAVTSDAIVIVAAVHDRREPGYWSSRTGR